MYTNIKYLSNIASEPCFVALPTANSYFAIDENQCLKRDDKYNSKANSSVLCIIYCVKTNMPHTYFVIVPIIKFNKSNGMPFK